MAVLEKVKLADLKGKQFTVVKEEYLSEKNKQDIQNLFTQRINGEQYCNEFEIHNNIKVNILEENDYLFNREFTCDNLQVYVMPNVVESATKYFNNYGKVVNTEVIEKINRVKLTIKDFKMTITQGVDKKLDRGTLNIKNSLAYTITDEAGNISHGNPIKASELKCNNGKLELHRETLMHVTIKYTVINV